MLRYVPGAQALTDPPDSVIGLIKQRRRWTNGSLFASWYVLDHLNMISRSGHSCFRKSMLSLLYMYMLINFVFTLTLVGSLYASFHIFIKAFFDEEECDDFGGARAFEIAYLALLFIFILIAITKPIGKSGWVYTLFVIVFGVFIFVSIGFGALFFWEENENIYIAGLLVITLIGSYFLPPLLNFWRMNIFKYFFGVIILIFLTPTYINIIIIYSMANLHDVSWGNRATDNKKDGATRKNLEQFRSLYLIVWIGVNAVYGYAIIYISTSETNRQVFMFILTVSKPIIIL